MFVEKREVLMRVLNVKLYYSKKVIDSVIIKVY